MMTFYDNPYNLFKGTNTENIFQRMMTQSPDNRFIVFVKNIFDGPSKDFFHLIYVVDR